MNDKERELIAMARNGIGLPGGLTMELAEALEALLSADVGERDLINANKVLKSEVDQLLSKQNILRARVEELECQLSLERFGLEPAGEKP